MTQSWAQSVVQPTAIEHAYGLGGLHPELFVYGIFAVICLVGARILWNAIDNWQKKNTQEYMTATQLKIYVKEMCLSCPNTVAISAATKALETLTELTAMLDKNQRDLRQKELPVGYVSKEIYKDGQQRIENQIAGVFKRINELSNAILIALGKKGIIMQALSPDDEIGL